MSHIEYRIIMKAQISQPGGADGGEWAAGGAPPPHYSVYMFLCTCTSWNSKYLPAFHLV